MAAEDAISAFIAFGLGYFVYGKWKARSAKWVWLAGVCWFGWRALHVWYGQGAVNRLYGRSPVLLWEISGDGYRPDPKSAETWLVYTLVMVRTAFYSVGAYCCASYRESIGNVGRGIVRWLGDQWRAYRDREPLG